VPALERYLPLILFSILVVGVALAALWAISFDATPNVL